MSTKRMNAVEVYKTEGGCVVVHDPEEYMPECGYCGAVQEDIRSAPVLPPIQVPIVAQWMLREAAELMGEWSDEDRDTALGAALMALAEMHGADKVSEAAEGLLAPERVGAALAVNMGAKS